MVGFCNFLTGLVVAMTYCPIEIEDKEEWGRDNGSSGSSYEKHPTENDLANWVLKASVTMAKSKAETGIVLPVFPV